MSSPLKLVLDRDTKTSLTEQIYLAIAGAISAGVLAPGARLPSWRDLAAQLGVARGTVRAAYERLQDEQLIESARARGTHVAERPQRIEKAAKPDYAQNAIPEAYREFSAGTGIFQMGVPAPDCFPAKLFARIRARAVRAELSALTYPDPRGDLELRREIAAHLAMSRSLECVPSQIIVTAGFTGALGLIMRVLRSEGRSAWMEEPGFPLTRRALQIAQMKTVPIPVDANGLNVEEGLKRAPDAAVAVVTAGQQAPLGPTLSLSRRIALLDWAALSDGWIIEDDYLGELQLKGRAAPALASLDRAGRVIYVGSFSKTISPTLRLGFVVAPLQIAAKFDDAATCLAPAPGPAVQRATAEFMRDGHFLRHLRRMKRVYASRRDDLESTLRPMGLSVGTAGLAILLELPAGAEDTRIAREATAFGLAPSPLSGWYSSRDHTRSGLLLGITTVPGNRLAASCEKLRNLIDQHG